MPTTHPESPRPRRRIWLVWKLIALCTVILAGAAAWIAYRPVRIVDYRAMYQSAVEQDLPPDAHDTAERTHELVLSLYQAIQEAGEAAAEIERTKLSPGEEEPDYIEYSDFQAIPLRPGSSDDAGDVAYARLMLSHLDKAGAWQDIDSIGNSPIFIRDLGESPLLADDFDIIHCSPQLRRCMSALQARMYEQARAGNGEGVVRSFASGMTLAVAYARLGLVMDWLISASNQTLLIHTMSRVINDNLLSSNELEHLADSLNSLPTVIPLSESLKFEHTYILAGIQREHIQASPSERLQRFVLQRPGRAETERAIDRFFSQLIPIFDQPGHSRPRLSLRDQDRTILDDLRLLSFIRTPVQVRDGLTCRLDGLRLYVAIERYKLANGGRPPGSLDDLVPTFLPTIPRDHYAPDGAFRYTVLGDSYTLYSVGLDRSDDGGTPAPPGEPADVAFFPDGAGTDYLIGRPVQHQTTE